MSQSDDLALETPLSEDDFRARVAQLSVARARQLNSSIDARKTWRNSDQGRLISPNQGGLSNLWRSLNLDNSFGMAARVVAETEFEPEKGYTIWQDPNLRGKEHLMQHLLFSKSTNETKTLLERYERNDYLRRELENSNASWSRFFGGLLDPLNWIPLPGLRGITFTRGLMRGAGSIGATSAITEVGLQYMDPTRPIEEMYTNIGTGFFLGGAIGGPLGAWKIHGGYRDADAGWGQGKLYAKVRNSLADRFNINSIGARFDEGMRQGSAKDANLVAAMMDDLSPYVIDHLNRYKNTAIGVNPSLHDAISQRLILLEQNLSSARKWTAASGEGFRIFNKDGTYSTVPVAESPRVVNRILETDRLIKDFRSSLWEGGVVSFATRSAEDFVALAKRANQVMGDGTVPNNPAIKRSSDEIISEGSAQDSKKTFSSSELTERQEDWKRATDAIIKERREKLGEVEGPNEVEAIPYVPPAWLKQAQFKQWLDEKLEDQSLNRIASDQADEIQDFPGTTKAKSTDSGRARKQKSRIEHNLERTTPLDNILGLTSEAQQMKKLDQAKHAYKVIDDDLTASRKTLSDLNAEMERAAEGQKESFQKDIADQVNRIKELEEAFEEAGDSVKHEESILDRINDFDEYNASELAPTGVNGEKIHWDQMPWYVLANNAFRKVEGAERLGHKIRLIGYRLAAPFGVRTRGQLEGTGTGQLAVEAAALLWREPALKGKSLADQQYLKLIGHDVDLDKVPTAIARHGYKETAQNVVEKVSKFGGKTTRERLANDYDGVAPPTYEEWGEILGKAQLMPDGKFINELPEKWREFVDEAIRAKQAVFREYHEAFREVGMYKNTKNVQRKLDSTLSKLNRADRQLQSTILRKRQFDLAAGKWKDQDLPPKQVTRPVELPEQFEGGGMSGVFSEKELIES